MNKILILKNDLKQNLANSNFLTEQTQRLVDENNFAASEFVNKNLIVYTFSKILLENNEALTIVISEISNEIMLAVEERKNFVLRSVLIAAIIILIFSYLFHYSI